MSTPEHQYPQGTQSPPVAPQPPKRAPLGLISLIVGIVAFLVGFIAVAGFVLGAAAITLGIIALKKRHPKGMPITGIVLGAIGAIVSLTMSYFLLFGFPQSESLSVAEMEDQWEQEQIDEGNLPEETTPSFEFPSDFDPSEFSEIDAAQLESILADPDGHTAESVIVYGSWGEPLVHPEAEELGLCLLHFNATATPESADARPTANVMGLGESKDGGCEMTDRFMDSGAGEINAETLAESRKVYAVVMGTSPIASPDNQDLPGLLVLSVE